jgi:uncharacterized protein (TIGR02996 family)
VEPYFRKIKGAEGFVDAIADDPDNDAYRLIFADWLAERGHEPRARFLRAQCRLERLEQAGEEDDPEYAEREEEADELLAAHGTAWVTGLPTVAMIDWRDGFRRGMLEAAVIGAAVATSGAALALLFAAADIHCLVVKEYADVEAEGARALAGSPHLTNLRHLILESNRIGPEGARALAASPHLANLRSLDLRDNEIGAEGAQALAASS